MILPPILRLRNFRLLFVSTAATNLGDGVVAVAVPWFATLLTRDPVLVGLVAATRQAPWFLFALPAGVLTDRFDHRRTLIACDLARIAVGLALVALAVLAQPGTGAVLGLAGLTFALGTAEVLRDNTAQTFLPLVVPNDRLEQANGLLWSTEQAAGQFVGPPLAGLMIAAAIALPFGLQAAALALAVALVARMALPAATGPRVAPLPFGPALREGLVWLWRHPVLRRLALALGAFNFVGSLFWALFVLYAQEVLGLGPQGYGLVMAAVAVGGLAGSLIGPALLARMAPSAGLFLGLGGFIAASLAMALTRNLWLIGALLVAEAFCGMLWNLTTVSYRQRHIPPALLGRVNAAYRFFGTGPSAFGALAGGVLVAAGAGLGPVAALQLPYALTAAGAGAILAYAASRLRLS